MFKLKHVARENLKLREQIIDASKDLESALREKESIDVTRRQQAETIQILTKELNSTKKKIREQTEADLLINALKALKIIPENKSGEVDYYAQGARLQNQLSQARQFLWDSITMIK